MWQRALNAVLSALSLLVFASLDLFDVLLCFAYRLLDALLVLHHQLESPITPCYCYYSHNSSTSTPADLSETLHTRRNLFRNTFSFLFLLPSNPISNSNSTRADNGKLLPIPFSSHPPARWSDCSCHSCISWHCQSDAKLLHVLTNSPPIQGPSAYDNQTSETENVIFIHGFLSSSSFWTQTVFPHTTHPNFNLFAVDLLGFGRSPKPADCLYRLKDHISMIEKSVIEPYQLQSFHIVAHSMGCMIALNLAARYPNQVKSITLLAPSYFPSSVEKASHNALSKLAEKKIWPPLAFGSAVMSWYEHVGRTVCLVFCRNHLLWERILKLITGKRELHFLITEMTKHTHHSAWHTMHNVICGGAKSQDEKLEIIKKAGISVRIIHGDKDQVVPVECSYDIKLRVPQAELQIRNGEDHNSMIIGREKEFTRELEEFWFSSDPKTNTWTAQ